MKKNIKRLSLILAIMLLSMTLAVPATAVEYDIELRRIYVIESNNVVYLDPESGEDLLCCYGVLSYNDNSKVAYMSADCSLGSTIYEYQYFGVDIDGSVNCSSGYNDRYFSGSAFGDSVHDIAEVDLSEDVAADCISITSGNVFYVGSSTNAVVDFALYGVEGVDFDY